jgi:hypothetical protein
MKSFPQVRFITGSDAIRIFADSAHTRQFSPADLRAIAQAVTPEVSFQTHGDYALSASEVFELLNSYVAQAAAAATPSTRPLKLADTPYGPSSAPPQREHSLEVSWDQFTRTVADVSDYLSRAHQIPTAVWLGSAAVAPEDYLVALASAAKTLLAGERPPNVVTVPAARLAAAAYVAEDSPALWDWPIFSKGFHSAHLMALARLQAWTLKPAVLP